jgi:GTPase SAR1 family protein
LLVKKNIKQLQMLIIKEQKPFLVYDITRKETFDSVDKWIPDLKVNGNKNISIIIIGNKSDLEDRRQVTKEDAE